jgi:hypothetical protein
MTMPKFTGEASLYQTSGQYRTDRHAISSAARITETIHPAEIIEVGGCHPGTFRVDLPNGGYECWSQAEPWLGGEGGGGGSTMPGKPDGIGEGPHGPGGGGVGPMKGPKPWRDPIGGCTSDQLQSDEAAPCLKKREDDMMNNVPPKNRHYVRCTGSRMECCQKISSQATVCQNLS